MGGAALQVSRHLGDDQAQPGHQAFEGLGRIGHQRVDVTEAQARVGREKHRGCARQGVVISEDVFMQDLPAGHIGQHGLQVQAGEVVGSEVISHAGSGTCRHRPGGSARAFCPTW